MLKYNGIAMLSDFKVVTNKNKFYLLTENIQIT